MPAERNLSQKLREELVVRHLISEEMIKHCVQESETNHFSFVESLYRSSVIAEKEIIAFLCDIFGCSSVNLGALTISPDIQNLIPKTIAKKNQVIPIDRYEKTLTVAIADPSNLSLRDDLKALVGLRIKPMLAPPSDLEAAIQKYYESGKLASTENESLEQIIKMVDSGDASHLFRKSSEASDLLAETKTSPIIQLVNHILIEAIRRRASDVFIEPWEKTMRCRFRVDGILEEILTAPRGPIDEILSRIKVMSRLNIAEHRIPQDGRIRVKILGREIDLRVSILPTCYGEKACLRILDSNSQTQNLKALGFGAEDLVLIERNAQKPHGMILVTGPTGSGKTTTLYAVLQYLDSPEKNITTVEDPVEYQVRGINQVNIRDQVGMTFPVALRSILRQDPDIILIGEIRDLITMDIAIKAALTGHLVLSTLHTNDATSAIVRMVNMGIEPFLITSSVLMISAQRLVRQLCTICKHPYLPDSELLNSLGLNLHEKMTFFQPKGCRQCRNGFAGRTVITELFELKPPITDLVLRGGSGEELRVLAREKGMQTLRENGIQKAVAGLTSIEEVLRVTSPEPMLTGGKSR